MKKEKLSGLAKAEMLIVKRGLKAIYGEEWKDRVQQFPTFFIGKIERILFQRRLFFHLLQNFMAEHFSIVIPS